MKLPLSILSKIGVYDIDSNGFRVKATLVDKVELVEAWLAERQNELALQREKKRPIVVGLDIKAVYGYPCSVPYLLILFVGRHCLVVQLRRILKCQCMKLLEFLSDDTICFVGPEVGSNINLLCQLHCFGDTEAEGLKCGADINELAARVLKNPALLDKPRKEVASVVGLYLEQNNVTVDWTSRVFSPEQIRYAIYEAHASYIIGEKLLGML